MSLSDWVHPHQRLLYLQMLFCCLCNVQASPNDCLGAQGMVLTTKVGQNKLRIDAATVYDVPQALLYTTEIHHI